MCPQTVGLIAAELERHGISTVCVQPIHRIAKRLQPPRSLVVPFGLGHPLGRPNEPELQHSVLESMLRLLEDPSSSAPCLAEWAAA